MNGTATRLDVSVVIPTYRRDDLLRRCLEAVAAQDFPRDRFEIVVVDDAVSPSTPAILAAIAGRCPEPSIRLLPGRGLGPAAARNTGWRAARGTVIAFIDDDAYPADAGWLRAGFASCRDGAALVAGRVSVPAPERPTDFQRNVKGLERGMFVTCNAFCRRGTLEAVGGFDERFRVAYREDSDLQFRIEAAGGRLVRNARAHVIHPAAAGPFAVSLKLQRYSAANALIYKKHPERYRRDLERRPPLHYYAGTVAALAAAIALTSGRRRPAMIAGAVWAAFTGRFFLRRARGTSRHPRHLLDLALTSLLIPPLSIHWRLRGALCYRVLFW